MPEDAALYLPDSPSGPVLLALHPLPGAPARFDVTDRHPAAAYRRHARLPAPGMAVMYAPIAWSGRIGRIPDTLGVAGDVFPGTPPAWFVVHRLAPGAPLRGVPTPGGVPCPACSCWVTMTAQHPDGAVTAYPCGCALAPPFRAPVAHLPRVGRALAGVR